MPRLIAIMIWLSALATASHAAQPVDGFRLGNWNGQAYINDAGTFDSCVARAPYRSGIAMLVQVDGAYNWAIGFASDSWNLQVGREIPLQYRIDRGSWQSGVGIVGTTSLIRMEMPADGYLVTRFRRGRTLYVYDGAQTYEFRLTGTSRLMRRLARCVQTNVARYGAGSSFANTPPAPGTSAPPQMGGATAAADPNTGGVGTETYSPPSAPVAPPAGTSTTAAADPAGTVNDPQLVLEATQYLFNVMGSSGLFGLKLVDDADRDADLKGLHAVAANEARAVVAHVFPAGTYGSEQQLVSLSIAETAKACEGDFSSGTDSRTIDGVTVTTGMTTCATGDVEITEHYLLVPRSAGGIYVTGYRDTFVGEGGGAPVSPPPLEPIAYFQAAVAAGQ